MSNPLPHSPGARQGPIWITTAAWSACGACYYCRACDSLHRVPLRDVKPGGRTFLVCPYTGRLTCVDTDVQPGGSPWGREKGGAREWRTPRIIPQTLALGAGCVGQGVGQKGRKASRKRQKSAKSGGHPIRQFP